MSEDNELVVLDRVAGELVSLSTATEIRLAELADAITSMRSQLAEDERLVNLELLDRLDRQGKWTLRVGDPDDDVQWELTAPSKTAGTTGYDADKLRGYLVEAIEAGAIDSALARAALRRSVSIVAYVDPGADLGALVESIEGLAAIGDVPVHDVKVSVTEAAADAGVKRLTKAGFGRIVDDVTVQRPAPPRRVKIKAKRRER